MKQYISPITLLVRLHTENLMVTLSGGGQGTSGDEAETRQQGQTTGGSAIWDSWSN